MTRLTVQEITPWLFRVPIPVPLPLKFVNCYLVQGTSGWSVVDTGMRFDLAEATWEQALAELGLTWKRIGTILVTHYHPDHYGAAGWMQARSGATVVMSPVSIETVAKIWEPHPTESAAAMHQLFGRHGMTDDMQTQIADLIHLQKDQTLPHPTLTALDPAAPLLLGDRPWQVIDAPGHADGQICLFEPQAQILLAADQVLPGITPNVSVWPESDPNPLQAYLTSLPRIAELPARLVLPGHREPLSNLRERCAEIIAHHDERLAAMQALAGAGQTAYQVSMEAFPLTKLTAHQVRFAMAETLAHLVYLESRGRVRSIVRDDVVVFSNVEAVSWL